MNNGDVYKKSGSGAPRRRCHLSPLDRAATVTQAGAVHRYNTTGAYDRAAQNRRTWQYDVTARGDRGTA